MSLVETAEGTITTKRLATRTDIQWDPYQNPKNLLYKA